MKSSNRRCCGDNQRRVSAQDRRKRAEKYEDGGSGGHGKKVDPSGTINAKIGDFKWSHLRRQTL